MFQVLAPAGSDVNAVRRRLRSHPDALAALLPEGARWYQVGRREQVPDATRLAVTPNRSRLATRLPHDPNLAARMVAHADVVREAEARARRLARVLGFAQVTFLWRLGTWSTQRPVTYPTALCPPYPWPSGPWTRLGRWVAALEADPDPARAALTDLLRLGVGFVAAHDGLVTLFLPDGPAPSLFTRDHPALVRRLRSQLAAAARTGDHRRIEQALADGAEPEDPQVSPLFAALSAPASRRRGALALLVERGASTEVSSWWTLPYFAATRGALDDLLAAGVCVDARGRDGTTGLHDAVRARQHDLLRELLSAGADPNLADVRGWTPLHLAMALPDPVAQLILVEAGARNLVDHAGIGAAEPGERPSPPVRDEGTLPPGLADVELAVFADWLESQGDPRGSWIQEELTGRAPSAERTKALRAEALRRVSALHPVLAEHCLSMVTIESGLVVAARAERPEQDPGVRQLLLHPEGGRIRDVTLCTSDRLDPLITPALQRLTLQLDGPASVQIHTSGLRYLRIRGCRALDLDAPWIRHLDLRLPLTRDRPCNPLARVHAPRLAHLELELPWVPDPASAVALGAVLAGLPLRSLLLQPVEVGAIDRLLASGLLVQLERLELRSLRRDGLDRVLTDPAPFAHLELVLTVLSVPAEERRALQEALREHVPRAVIKGQSYRADGAYDSR